MDLNVLLSDLSKDVETLDEYLELISKIKSYVNNKKAFKGKQINCYYRGDSYCAPLQSHFFRSGDISQEANNFQHWQENCPIKSSGGATCDCSVHRGKYTCLAHMQHYNDTRKDHLWQTRLLDFSTCPLVALCFACGKEDNCRKKVTVFITADPWETCDSDRINKLMEMVNCSSEEQFQELYSSDTKGFLKQDVFVEIPSQTERVKRQHALTLFMGNLTTGELLTGKPDPASQNSKVIHQLNQNIGRGKGVYGYIATIGIHAKKIGDVRKDLVNRCNLSDDYLMINDYI